MQIQTIKSAFRNRTLKKLLIITAMLLLLAAFSHVFYYQPHIDNIRKSHEQINNLQIQLLSLKSLNDPSNNLQSLTMNVQRINKKLNYTVDTLKLSKLIHGLSKNHGVKIIRQTNSEGEGRDKGKTLKQTLAIEGNYRQLRAFIDGIYQLPSMTVIQEASILKKSGKNKQLTGSLLLLTFHNNMVRS